MRELPGYGIGDLNAPNRHLLGGQRSSCQLGIEGVPLEELHHEIGLAVLLSHVVERADVRMIERRGGARFLEESLLRLDISRRGIRQELHRHLPAQPGIASTIDLAHASRSERGEDFVGSEAEAGGEVSPPEPEAEKKPSGEIIDFMELLQKSMKREKVQRGGKEKRAKQPTAAKTVKARKKSPTSRKRKPKAS